MRLAVPGAGAYHGRKPEEDVTLPEGPRGFGIVSELS